MFADQVVRLATQVNKQLEAAGGTLAAVDDIRHVRGQDERGAVSVETDTGRSSLNVSLKP